MMTLPIHNLGPKMPIGMARTIYSYSSKLAPSYIPTPLLKKSSDGPVEEQVKKLSSSSRVVELLTPDLKNHAEQRIQLFLNQLLLVYNTKLKFEAYHQAEIQVGQVTGTQGDTYVGAHSGTLPTLRISNEVFSDLSVSFAKDSYFYYLWNTTIYLPEKANHVDSALDKAGFRNVATQILNQVSQGQKTPEKGLFDFLESLAEHLKNLKFDPKKEKTKKSIRDTYLRAVEIYLENMQDGYPLLQKLCHQPLTQKLDAAFYREVQTGMHNLLHEQMGEPEEGAPPSLPPDFDFASIQLLLQQKVQGAAYSKTRIQHVSTCAAAKKVQIAASQYLLSLHPLTLEQKKDELETIKNSPFGIAALEATEKTPNYFNHILYSTLLKIMQPLCNDPAELTPAEILQGQKLLDAKKPKTSPAATKYFNQIKTSERVKQAAKEFFKEIVRTKGETLAPIFNIKTKKKISEANLSEKGLAFYGKVRDELPKDPRNISYILWKLLKQASKE